MKIPKGTWAWAAALALLMAGCTPRGYVKASELLPACEKVHDRHDAYIHKDDDLSELQKRVYLRSSRLVIDTLRESAHPATFGPENHPIHEE